jgi:hypothetical protein
MLSTLINVKLTPMVMVIGAMPLPAFNLVAALDAD